jgi:hypothetical protein
MSKWRERLVKVAGWDVFLQVVFIVLLFVVAGVTMLWE